LLAIQEQEEKEVAVAEKERLKVALASALEDLQQERHAARANANAAEQEVRRSCVADRLMPHVLQRVCTGYGSLAGWLLCRIGRRHSTGASRRGRSPVLNGSD